MNRIIPAIMISCNEELDSSTGFEVIDIVDE